jgi:hypothetical protein
MMCCHIHKPSMCFWPLTWACSVSVYCCKLVRIKLFLTHWQWVRKSRSHWPALERDTRSRDREKGSGQIHRFNIGTIEARDRTAGQAQVKLDFFARCFLQNSINRRPRYFKTNPVPSTVLKSNVSSDKRPLYNEVQIQWLKNIPMKFAHRLVYGSSGSLQSCLDNAAIKGAFGTAWP